VNIHFTDPHGEEMKQLADAGFTFVRMDLSWAATEKSRGEYDWSEYETLLDTLAPHGIRAMLIFDYSNPLYDENLSPHTDAGRAACAKWTAAAVSHFKNRGVLWEMYNEPNIHFWRPTPNVDDYAKLALAVGKAVKSAAPQETYVGPATSTVDLHFLETCFKAGVLEYFDAVTVHPYRQTAPETAADDYRKLRQLVARYAPKNKSIPIYSGEWGYSSAWSGYDEDRQGLMLTRQFLSNIANDVPLSIWYDWHDDGPDAKEGEHHFGTVHHADWSEKAAYVAAKTLTRQLDGYRFNKRLALPREDDFLLLFDKADGGDALKLAAWTSSGEPHTVTIPALTDGRFDVVSHLGQSQSPLEANANGLSIVLGPGVQYLTPQNPQGELRRAARAERAALEIFVKAPGEALGRMVSRGQEPVAVDRPIGAFTPALAQRTMLVVSNPLRAALLPPEPGGLPVRIENPSGDPFFGTLRLSGTGSFNAIVNLPAGKTETTVSLAVPTFRGLSPDQRFAAELTDDSGHGVLVTPPTRFAPIDLSSPEKYAAHAEGDADVKSTQSISAGGDGPHGRNSATVKLNYRLEKGWKYVRIAPADGELARVSDKPKSLGVWVRSAEPTGDKLRCRFIDSTGQTFQPDGPRLDSPRGDWRYVSFPLTEDCGHWGGAADGVIHWPVKIDSLLLVDGTHAAHSGEVTIAEPTLIYEDSPALAPVPAPATTNP
jgi:polysaccharide biosynthesis protein PslG